MVDFAILGPLEAHADGEPIVLGGPKQRALLAMLLLEAGRVVSLDRLVDELWAGNPPATATASLQNFVAQLRKALGPAVIETRPPGYLVRLEPDQLDVARMRRLVDEARANEPARRAELLDEALAVWRGEPLAEFRYETFAQEEIARLEEFHLALLEERAEAKLAIGAHADLVTELAALLLLCGELGAASLHGRWRIRTDEPLVWRSALTLSALTAAGLGAAVLVVGLSALHPSNGIAWTAAGAAAAVGAAGTGAWLARR